jgi:hypothetical protein
MESQNYSNHRRTVAPFHFFVMPLFFLTFIGAGVNLYESWGDHERMYSASLILVLALCAMLGTLFGRMFALKAQDRAIRAEENLRHFALTGKLFAPALTMRQIIALRFAADAEFVALADRAAAENLEPDAIKRAIKNWRSDTDRA